MTVTPTTDSNDLAIAKPSLLTKYETLRRKESERLNALIDTFSRVDGLPTEQMEQARDALFHADHPYLIVLVGAFNTGKSSIINALIGEPVLEIGATPTTSKIAIVRHGPSLQRSQAGQTETVFFPHPLLEKVSLVDTPGLDSVFKGHDETTRKFLHRADMVLMVMLATQAMSAKSMESLAALRAYGKRVIIAINQIDLVEPEERETLRQFVADQSKQQLGFVPEVWLISSRLAAESQRESPRNEQLWRDSGFSEFDKFVNRALSDAERVRQKLDTPLQIVRNVMAQATATVREQQDALAEHRRSAQNVNTQIEAGLRDQAATLYETEEEINKSFAESIRRGREAIHDTFQWSRGVRLAFGGLSEIVGIGRFFRRFGAQTPAKLAFESHKVEEPLAQAPIIADRLGPRLEGRDVKDVDDLIGYTRKEIEELPASLQDNLIGTLQAPSSYDRSILRGIRDELMKLVDQARTVEFQRIDDSVRGSIAILAIYELLVIFVGILGTVIAASQNNGNWVFFFFGMIILMIAGVLVMPLRGMLLERRYADRLRGIKEEFTRTLDKAAKDQIAYGKQMRQDAVAPFMRLVDTQLSQIDKLKVELEEHQQAITALEKELSGLR
ncbi:MAG: dynamin family protein [Anaerolineae bacterium]|nr:dynamin family protein [Anaerolineae bacterium]